MSLNRCVKTRLAVKIGKNASGHGGEEPGHDGQVQQGRGRDHEGQRQRRQQHHVEPCRVPEGDRRDTATATSTLSRTPRNTSALTSHVVPNSRANCTTLLVSSSMKATPMKNRSV